MIRAKSWSRFVGSEDLRMSYYFAVLEAAHERYVQRCRSADENPDRVDLSNPEGIIAAVASGTPPPWWPSGQIPMLKVIVEYEDEDEDVEEAGEYHLDPNHPDMSAQAFEASVHRGVRSIGVPFEGQVRVVTYRMDSNRKLHAFRSQVRIGSKKKSSKGGQDMLLDRLERVNDQLLRHQENLSNASANIINASSHMMDAASRFQFGGQQEEEGSLFDLIPLALEVVGKAGKGDVSGAAESGGKLIEEAGRGKRGGHRQAPQGARMIEQDLGPDYDQFLVDGTPVDRHVMERVEIDDGEYEEEEEEEEWEEAPQEGRRRGSPLDGMSPEEVSAHLERWAETQDKRKVKSLGIDLAKKLF